MKLQSIFDDIDTDNSRNIDTSKVIIQCISWKAVVFNKFVEDSITDSVAEKDSRDFIKTAALCNQ